MDSVYIKNYSSLAVVLHDRDSIVTINSGKTHICRYYGESFIATPSDHKVAFTRQKQSKAVGDLRFLFRKDSIYSEINIHIFNASCHTFGTAHSISGYFYDIHICEVINMSKYNICEIPPKCVYALNKHLFNRIDMGEYLGTKIKHGIIISKKFRVSFELLFKANSDIDCYIRELTSFKFRCIKNYSSRSVNISSDIHKEPYKLAPREYYNTGICEPYICYDKVIINGNIYEFNIQKRLYIDSFIINMIVDESIPKLIDNTNNERMYYKESKPKSPENESKSKSHDNESKYYIEDSTSNRRMYYKESKPKSLSNESKSESPNNENKYHIEESTSNRRMYYKESKPRSPETIYYIGEIHDNPGWKIILTNSTDAVILVAFKDGSRETITQNSSVEYENLGSIFVLKKSMIEYNEIICSDLIRCGNYNIDRYNLNCIQRDPITCKITVKQL